MSRYIKVDWCGECPCAEVEECPGGHGVLKLITCKISDVAPKAWAMQETTVAPSWCPLPDVPEQSKNDRCGNCRFWLGTYKASFDIDGKHVSGVCRRRAPAYLPDKYQNTPDGHPRRSVDGGYTCW